MTGAPPIAKFRAGQVSSAIWSNEIEVNGSRVPMLKASVDRRFKGRDGQWKSATSFSRAEVPFAIWCLQKALDEMIRLQSTNGGENVEEEVIQ